MAQFTAGSCLKSIFSGDGLSAGFEFKDPFHHRPSGTSVRAFPNGINGGLRSIIRRTPHKGKLNFTAHVATSSPSSSAMDEFDDVFDEIMDEAESEFDIDELASEIMEETESEFDIHYDELANYKGLVLDISYRPVNVVCWKRAICLEFMDKVDVLEYYDQTVSSPSGSFYIPAVLRVPHLLQVVKRRTVKRGVSRKNIFHRDNYTCQYCSSANSLTIDHVLPIARGGKWTWENLVAACARCNSKKGHKTLEEANMKLMKVPKAPKDFDILAIPLTYHAMKMLKMRKALPEEWQQYLGKPFAAP